MLKVKSFLSGQSDFSPIKVCLGVFGGIGLLIASMTAWKLYKKRLEPKYHVIRSVELN